MTHEHHSTAKITLFIKDHQCLVPIAPEANLHCWHLDGLGFQTSIFTLISWFPCKFSVPPPQFLHISLHNSLCHWAQQSKSCPCPPQVSSLSPSKPLRYVLVSFATFWFCCVICSYNFVGDCSFVDLSASHAFQFLFLVAMFGVPRMASSLPLFGHVTIWNWNMRWVKPCYGGLKAKFWCLEFELCNFLDQVGYEVVENYGALLHTIYLQFCEPLVSCVV